MTEDVTETRATRSVGALVGYASSFGFGALHRLLAPRAGWVPIPLGALALTAGAMAGVNLPAVATGGCG